MKSLDRSDIIAVLAVVISMGALFVSLYETSILNEQQELMQAQQKASVWPYLEEHIVFNFEDTMSVVSQEIQNKGVGPAKIDNFTARFKGKIEAVEDAQVLSDYAAFLNAIQTVVPNDAIISFSYASPEGILSADESIMIFKINIRRFPNDRKLIPEVHFYLDLCYCSIYQDCWKYRSEVKEPIPGCSPVHE